MKKIVTKLLLILLVLLVFYLVFNQFDIGELTPEFSEKDIPPATFNKNNGYYRLWTLTEPVGTDIESDEVLNQYRRLFDPQFDNDKYIGEFDPQRNKRTYSSFLKIYRKAKFNLKNPEKDWTPDVLSQKMEIEKLKEDLKVFLDRYKKLIDCEVFEDFTLLRWDSPIPNLLAWLHAAKLYIAINILDAKEGNWTKSVSNLLDHLNFSKKAVKGSRVLINNLIGKAVTKFSIRALAGLMNQKDCPVEVFQQVLDNTPPLKYEEFGSRAPIIAEGFLPVFYESEDKMNFLDRILKFLFFQKNRIRRIRYNHASKMLEYEKTSPYKWESDFQSLPKFKSGWFWWLQNPLGKIWLDNEKWGLPYLESVIFKSYVSKAFYDMLRISAELHLSYTPDKPVQQILNGLETYKTLLDPCSGKPYLWNERKQILYSIGVDRKDNKGETNNYTKIDGTDFVIPVILYVK